MLYGIPRNTNCWRWKSGPIWTSFGSIHTVKNGFCSMCNSLCVSLTIPRFFTVDQIVGPWIQYQVPPSHKYPSSRTVCHICRNFKTSSKTGKQARTRNSAVRKLSLLQFHVSIRPTFGETVIVIETFLSSRFSVLLDDATREPFLSFSSTVLSLIRPSHGITRKFCAQYC